MNRSRRSSLLKSGDVKTQVTIQECFLAKFKSTPPERMSLLGKKKGSATSSSLNGWAEKLKKTPAPETSGKRSRVSSRLSNSPLPESKRLRTSSTTSDDEDSDDDNNNEKQKIKPKLSTDEGRNPYEKVRVSKSLDSDDSDDSDVEDLRLRNLEDNKKFLSQLGLEAEVKKARAVDASAEGSHRGVRRDVKGLRKDELKKREAPAPRRSSLRIQKIDSDGVALAPNYKEPSMRDIMRGKADVAVVFGRTTLDPTPKEPERPRKPDETIRMADHLGNGPRMDDDLDGEGTPFDLLPSGEEKEARTSKLNERRSSYVESLCSTFKSSKLTESDNVAQKSESDFTNSLINLKCGEVLERKVTKDRVFGIGIHPGVDRTIVAVGDKWGGVGLWTVDDDNAGDDGVHLFYPHSRPINALQFPLWAPNSLYTCSYDGTIRKGDFEKGVFDLVYATPLDDDVAISAFSFASPTVVLASDLDGGLSVLDPRSGTNPVCAIKAHPKSCRCVDAHPVDEHYCVTSGTDGGVHVWDLRKLGSKNPHAVVSASQARSVNSAYFSPVTGRQILTTGMDDFYRIYDYADKKTLPILKDLRHNNNTGRWLTKFRAAWYPRREDIILSGLMGHPRQIEIYSAAAHPKKLVKVASLLDEEVLGSICCVIQGHPYLPMVVGGNASGKVYVFK